ncbi:MAG: hypothetical protein LBQ46_00230 [Treponema sp.]|jgi:hypothetical protein|nr:hypothetical protein [Treponema sp.]
MKGFFRPRGLFAAALLALAAGLSAQDAGRPDGTEAPAAKASFAQSLAWSFRGTLMIFPEENGLKGAPMPLLPSPGAALAWRFWGPLEAELSLDLYFTHYGYDWDLGRPLPVEIENRSAFVLGALTGLQIGYRRPLGIGVLRAYLGPAADLRLVITAADLNEADLIKDDPWGAPMQVDAVRDYFWKQGRWFFPFAGAGFDFPVNAGFYFGIDFRVWFPAYRLWTAEDLPPLEGWRFGPALRISLR